MSAMEQMDITKAIENKIDRSKWVKWKFSDLVENIVEKVVPKDSGLEHYIGLKHLDTGSLKIKRFGETESLIGNKLKIYKGDLIFAKRNSYLKRVAIADFDAVASAHAMVLRPNADNVNPDFLPFFMMSELFWKRAIEISVGSLSPTINWKALAKQEFLLPPKEEQAQLAKLLWAMDEVIEKENKSKEQYELFYKRFLFDSVSGKSSKDSKTWKNHLFGSLGETFGGLNGKTKKDFGEGSPFVNYMNVFSNSKVDPSKVDYVKINEGEKQNELKYGDILITGSSETPEDLGMSSVVLESLEGYYLNSFCFGFRLNDFETLLPEYARFLMRGEHVRKFMFKRAQGSTRFNLSKTTVKEKMKVLLPTIVEQKKIADKLEFMEKNISTFESKISASKALQKSLINQVF